MRLLCVAAMTTALLAGCGSVNDNGPLMAPGADCLACHGFTAKTWTAAGTVFSSVDAAEGEGLEGVTVEIVDSQGKMITLVSNSVGNFYTAEELQLPLETAVEKDGVRLEADEPNDGGSCNNCHSIPPIEETDGRLYWAIE